MTELAVMGPKESEFVDRMGLYMERLGGTRTMGRMYAWLMICHPAHRSLTELADELGVSKTAISTVARQLESGGMIERVPAPGRQHHYRVVSGGWAQVLQVRLVEVRNLVETLDLGLAALDDSLPEQRARLEETRDFFAFTELDGMELLKRWEEHRKNRD
ncbi:MarR family transcriptional regulator [Nonomuraea sp. NPDC046802]|uniref:GbsR/MarR family transcriptional regulator n=1 Tax=Nonomuraea sp. NPDC046802 TaxID=3154919 RepID=UPI0033CD3BF3